MEVPERLVQFLTIFAAILLLSCFQCFFNLQTLDSEQKSILFIVTVLAVVLFTIGCRLWYNDDKIRSKTKIQCAKAQNRLTKAQTKSLESKIAKDNMGASIDRQLAAKSSQKELVDPKLSLQQIIKKTYENPTDPKIISVRLEKVEELENQGGLDDSEKKLVEEEKKRLIASRDRLNKQKN
jgi:hypothetical protein